MTRYLTTFALAFVALLLAVAGFTRLMDPAGYWGGPIVPGLNAVKPASAEHLRSVKLRQAERLQPLTIVAGNSRVDVGIDPGSRAWPRDWRPVYNLGLPGAYQHQTVDAVLHALDTTGAKRVVLGVDVIDYRVSEEAWARWRPSPRRPETIGNPRELAELLISLDALGRSLAAIPEQHSRNPQNITRQGFNSLAEYNDIVAAEGHAALFGQRLRENAARWATWPKAVAWPGPGGSDAWASLDRLAAECRRRGVELILVTYPYHAEVRLLFDELGMTPAFEDWRARLATAAARAGVPVWDFTAITPLTSEAVPPPGDTATHMRWYWEGGHFKASLGDRMIATIAGAPDAQARRLTPATAAAMDEADRDALDAYRATNPAVAAEVARMVAASLDKSAPVR
ncbi:MAG: hypothetical protein INF91_03345 [Alphaproteobacteria bacterium]|nr:hypothetical protein [Alphaproteobacteria bacterium]